MKSGSTLGGSAVVATGMAVMNLAVYVFSLVTARLLIPAEFGVFTALLGVLQIGTVASLGLQVAGARRIAVGRPDRQQTASTVLRSTALVSVTVGCAALALTPAMTLLLRLDSPWLMVLCAAALVPLTAMGGLSAIAQGTERWAALSAINVANGVGRLVAGVVALSISPTVTGALVGLALGAWLPVLVAVAVLRPRLHSDSPSRRGLLREALLSTHTLFAFFVLSNLDALVARSLLADHQAGLYAAGLIVSKTALLGPGFVAVVLFPRLARERGGSARLRGVATVAGLGALGVAATALLPGLALVLAGGDQYRDIAGRLWLFALAGSLLGIAQLLVFDALARRAHHITWVLWAAAVALPLTAVAFDVGVTGLVSAVAGIAATTAVALLVLCGPRRRTP